MRSSSQFEVPQPIKKRKLNIITTVLADVFDHEYSLVLNIIKDLTIVDFTNLILTCKRLNSNITKKEYFKWLLNRSSKYFIGYLNDIDPKIIPFLIKKRGVIAGGSVLRAITMIPDEIYGESNIDIFLADCNAWKLFQQYKRGDLVLAYNSYYLKISDNPAKEDCWKLHGHIIDAWSLKSGELPMVRSRFKCRNVKTGDIIQVFILRGDIIIDEREDGCIDDRIKFIRGDIIIDERENVCIDDHIKFICNVSVQRMGRTIIKWFDQSCCQCYFDGKTIYSMDIESQLRMTTKYLLLNSTQAEIPHEHQKRMRKYMWRGFKVII
jgi:hypothetical protein